MGLENIAGLNTKSSTYAVSRDSTHVPSEKTPPGYSISHPPIRALYGPRLSIMMIIFANDLPKILHFITNFYNKRFPHDLRQTERFPSSHETLIDANGRQNGRGLDSWHGQREKKACFGALNEGPFLQTPK
jgi:hypothetical protein